MFNYGFLQYVHVSWTLTLQPVQHFRHWPLRHSLGLVHHPQSTSQTLCNANNIFISNILTQQIVFWRLVMITSMFLQSVNMKNCSKWVWSETDFFVSSVYLSDQLTIDLYVTAATRGAPHCFSFVLLVCIQCLCLFVWRNKDDNFPGGTSKRD